MSGPVTTEYVALELETTGLNPGRDEIVEVAAILFGPDALRERLTTVIRPQRNISQDLALELLLEPHALANAPDWTEFAPRLRRFIAGRPLVISGSSFGLDMLRGMDMIITNAAYDPVDLATYILHDLPSYHLSGLAAVLGVERSAGRRAESVAAMSAGVFQRLLRRIERFDPATLEHLAYLLRVGEAQEADLFAAAAEARPSGPLFATADDAQRFGSHEIAFLAQRGRPDPLRETGSRKTVSPAAVKAALATRGPLSRTVRGYERRPQQETMALAVANAFNADRHLLVEAGTGTGKSLAYLLPSALHAIEKGETVVISTNTLALQDQLFRKDLPDLEAALGLDSEDGLTATVLKGRQNYLCLRSWFAWQRTPTFDPAEARLQARITTWLADTETGDRAELHLTAEEEQGWRHVAEVEDACVASRCPFQQRNQCFLYRARKRAEASHLVIVNHALLLSDVVAPSRILPEYDRLIVDEAHHLEDQATTQFSQTVSERDLADIADSMARRDGPVAAGTIATSTAFIQRHAVDDKSRLVAGEAGNRVLSTLSHADALRTSATRLFAAVGQFAIERTSGGPDRTLRLTTAVRANEGWEIVEQLLLPVDGALRELDGEIRWFDTVLDRLDLQPGDEDVMLQRDELRLELAMAARSSAELASRLRSAVSAPDESMVYWIERWQSNDRSSLHAAPIAVGDMLRDQLFANMRTSVLTSATLTTDGTFDYIENRIGMDHAETLAVSSPFDYESSTLLYLVDNIPEPSAPGYSEALQQMLIDTCAATGGRALVLFTSYASLRATAAAIRNPLLDRGIVTLAQKTDGTPRQLIERLRQSPATVLLGTATFWEGVDIVGPALSLLVITKLPFTVPTDPVFAARSERFDNPFSEYAIPQAVLKFKQGFGRLIRSSKDRGVCAVLDRRVLSKRYGTSFVASLPSCSVRVGSGYDLPGAAASWIDVGKDGVQ